MLKNLIYLGFLLSIISCHKESDCDSHLMGSISEIDYKDTVQLGSFAIYHLKVAGFNGCSQLESITDKVNGKEVIVTGTIYNKGCVCTMVAPFFEGTYTFTPNSTGTYLIKFTKDLNAVYLVDTVYVK